MFSGRIYDKIGARTPALLGFLFSLIAIAMLMFANENSALAYIIACHVVLMIGVSLAMSPCQTYALASLPHHLSTDGSAVINTLQQVMGAVCTALVTFLVSSTSSAFLSQNTNTTQAIAFSQGAHVGFLFVAILACIGFVFALQIKKQTQSAQALQGEGTHAGRAGTAAQPQAQAELSLETTGKTAASAALQQKEEAGAGIHISNLMKTDVYVLQETDSTLDALRLFASKKISGAPVVNEAGKVVGFISDGDIIGTLAKQTPKFSSFYAYTIEGDSDSFNEKSDALAQMSVAQLATRNVISVNTSDDMRSVCATLALHHLKKAPVMENGKMVGIINRSDITRYTVSLY